MHEDDPDGEREWTENDEAESSLADAAVLETNLDATLLQLAAADDNGFAHGMVSALLEVGKEIGQGMLQADYDEERDSVEEGRAFDPQKAHRRRVAFVEEWTARELTKPVVPPQSTETPVAFSLPRRRIVLVDSPFGGGLLPAVIVGPLERPGEPEEQR